MCWHSASPRFWLERICIAEKATVKVRIGFKQKDPRILPDMGIKVTFLDETDGGMSSVETSSAH